MSDLESSLKGTLKRHSLHFLTKQNSSRKQSTSIWTQRRKQQLKASWKIQERRLRRMLVNWIQIDWTVHIWQIALKRKTARFAKILKILVLCFSCVVYQASVGLWHCWCAVAQLLYLPALGAVSGYKGHFLYSSQPHVLVSKCSEFP